MKWKLTSSHFWTHGLKRAHASSPLVANIKMNTIASSFLESLSVAQPLLACIALHKPDNGAELSYENTCSQHHLPLRPCTRASHIPDRIFDYSHCSWALGSYWLAFHYPLSPNLRYLGRGCPRKRRTRVSGDRGGWWCYCWSRCICRRMRELSCMKKESLASRILSRRSHDLARSRVGSSEMTLTGCYSKRCECEK